MIMFFLIDSREKPRAITKIIDAFQQNGIDYDVCKLYVGDYMRYDNPRLVVDRKQSLEELAANCTTDKERFKRELERAKRAGAHVVVLVEQAGYSINGEKKNVREIADLIGWQSYHSAATGERVFRVLNAWIQKYPMNVQFVNRRDTGRKIIEILGEKTK